MWAQMKKLSIIIGLIIFSSPVFAEDKPGKGGEEFYKLLEQNKDQAENLVILFSEGGFFIKNLQQMGAFYYIKNTAHGQINTIIGEGHSIEDLQNLFPFEGKYVLKVDGDTENEYTYVVTKSSNKAPWKMIKASKQNHKTKITESLSLPNKKNQKEASRLVEENPKKLKRNKIKKSQ